MPLFALSRVDGGENEKLADNQRFGGTFGKEYSMRDFYTGSDFTSKKRSLL